MEEQGLIQMNIRIPVGAVEGLTRLAEGLARLAEAVEGGAASAPPVERGENAAFRPQRFQEMRRELAAPESVQAPDAEVMAGAEPVRAAVRGTAAEPESAWQAVEDVPEHSPAPAKEAPPDLDAETLSAQLERELRDLEAVRADAEARVPEAPAARTEEGGQPPEARPVREEADTPVPDARAVEGEAEIPIPEAPALRMELESQIPEAEAVWAEPRNQAPAPATVPPVFQALEAPLSAGGDLSSAPEQVLNRWTGVTEELAAAGPAPLTAEAVSLAFSRDGRRYDNGFPLY